MSEPLILEATFVDLSTLYDKIDDDSNLDGHSCGNYCDGIDCGYNCSIGMTCGYGCPGNACGIGCTC